MAEGFIIRRGGGAGSGGIPPLNMKVFTATSSNQKAKITATLPSNTVIEGQTLVVVAGAIIRRRTDKFPETEFDGDLVKDIKRSEVFIDEGTVAGNTYYYSAFPYSDQNIFNRNPKNQAKITVTKREYLYGYKINLADQEPSTRVSYDCQGIDNRDFVKAKMNFGGSFDYGSWNFNPGTKFMPRPCFLPYDCDTSKRYYLNPNNYSQKADGGDSRIADETVEGNFMMEWPKIYTLRWEANGEYHFCCSDQPISKEEVGAPLETLDSDCWCNYDKSDNIIPHFYTPIYFGSNVSGKLRSLSGKSGIIEQTADTEISYAKKNGADWYTEFIVDRLLISDLLVMMAKTTDTQKAYGNGCCDRSSAISSGSMDKNGMFWGSSNNTSGVKVFGMENYWGNIWHRIAGWIMVSGSQKIKLTRGRHDGTSVAEYNTTGSGYLDVGAPAPSGSSNGYINKMKTTPYGRFPHEANGSSTTYEADGLWFNNSGTMYAYVGGNWNVSLGGGLFCLAFNYDPSRTGTHLGAALSCKPSI